ncbi:MAG: hypothetical protein ACON5K_08980, partial [Bacteroidia bacterium]
MFIAAPPVLTAPRLIKNKQLHCDVNPKSLTESQLMVLDMSAGIVGISGSVTEVLLNEWMETRQTSPKLF